MSQTLSLSGATERVSRSALRALLEESIAGSDPIRKALIVPPDFTRFHSGAGEITEDLYELLAPNAEVHVLPALGTHAAMSERLLKSMFGSVPLDAFRVHDWREGIVQLGEVPAEFVSKISGERVDYPIFAEVDTLIAKGGYDRVFSVGQVVPHEVIGMANHNKNIFVGTGGQDTINKTHFLGAVCDMESTMGRAESPVRQVLDYAEDQFLDVPVTYVLTVRERDDELDELVSRGVWVGEGREGFHEACQLSQAVNIDLVDQAFPRVVVYLDPEEFHSTWLGNKSIYRTRMAMADDADLIVLAPGLKEFGEDPEIDRLIRKYGYRRTPEVLDAVKSNEDLRGNLSAAAHLIHGSSEGRFRITYAPGNLSKEEVEGVGYQWDDWAKLEQHYRPKELKDGFHRHESGEEFYFISNPALGLWALRENFT
ncbi:MAG: lactate racemase domain-containing protein [Planctomycetota bacterium]